jgi:DNA-binding beta-propeller fold protein YncE
MAEEPSALSSDSTLSGNPLVVDGAESFVGGQMAAAEEAKRMNPEAVATRASSESAYGGLDNTSAGAIAKTYFPELFSQTDGGLPSSVAEHVSKYVGPYAAELDEVDGQRHVVESSQPIAQETLTGGWKPLGLGIRAVSAAFEADSPIVQVRASERLDEGVQLPGLGVTVVPLTSPGGSASSAQGVADGSTVFFGNTQTDTDTVFKPSTFGFTLDSVQRSSKSPSVLSFHLGLPAHTTLVSAPGGIDIVREGVAIAEISSPTARDAAGRAVPVRMTWSGVDLKLEVSRSAGETQYPIYVDPEYNVISEALTVGNWHYGQSEGFTFENGGNQLRALHAGKVYPAGDYGYWATETPGSTSIYKEELKDVLEPTSPYEVNSYPYYSAWADIEGQGERVLSGSPYTKSATICGTGCSGKSFTFEVMSLESSTAAKEKEHLSEAYYYDGTLTSATTYIEQAKEIHSTVFYYTEQPSIEYTHEGKIIVANNVMYGSNNYWLGPNSGVFKYRASDTGLGVAGTSVEVYKGTKWEVARNKNYLTEEGGCIGVRCSPSQEEVVTWSMISGFLGNGRDKIRVAAHDPMSGTSSSEHSEGEATIDVDNEAPYNITISGLPAKGEEYELGEVQAHVKVEATDGSGSIPSSGIGSLAIEIDGSEVPWPSGTCTEGPCNASAEWSLNGAELGAGSHTLTLVATDRAGNVASRELVLNVYHASPLSLGPGSVNPESGDFALEASDVNLSGGMGPLTVSRHYDSRNLLEGANGPLGPQWSIDLGSLASLEVLPDESVMIVGPEGLTHFANKEGKFEAPEGDSSLTLEYKTGEYVLSNKDKGTTTRFTLPSGATQWMPTTSTGPVATDTTTDEYETVEPEAGKKIVEPTLELAPHPSTTCVHNKQEIKWEAGCRGLTFVYATTKTATGENPTEWGEYTGRLKEVIALVYNPTTKKLQEPAPVVAKYEYDVHGRLRAEWDPRVSPALKVTYGYDEEGHITALTQPGRQPWIFMYGLIPGDLKSAYSGPSGGRLLKATHAQPTAGATKEQIEEKLKEQASQPKNIEAPKITGSPIVGVRLAVSTGKWSGSPVSYGYQWEDCTYGGCLKIPGAANPNYTPQKSDVKYKLAVTITANNGGGAVRLRTSETGWVYPSTPPVYSLKAGVGQFEGVGDMAIDSKGNVWVVDTYKARVQEYNEKGELLRTVGKEGTGPGEFRWPQGIAIDPKNNVWVTDYGRHRVEIFKENGEYLTQFGELGNSGEKGQFKEGPFGIGADTKGNVWIASDGYVEKFNEKHEYETRFKPRENAFASGVGVDSTNGNIWVATGSEPHRENGMQIYNEKLEWLKEFGREGIEGEKSTGWGTQRVKPGSSGNMWVYGREYSESGAFLTEINGLEPSLLSITGSVGDTKGNVWIADQQGEQQIQKWTPGSSSEGEYHAPQPGSTIEYNVPVSGTGAPHEMTAGEVSKWGEKDDPTVAAAIFPPDEPQSWPATQYKRATVEYLDGQARTVNVMAPGGGIATSEYDEENNVVRTLSAANRATALKEANPVESAKLLDTESKYAEEGTELIETTGPQHKIRLASGSEVEARSHVKYSYDEGAPSGEEYGLVTKTVDSSLVAGKEEEPRTTRAYYSGQKGLGWKLRQPTSTVTDPTGVDLTRTTLYNETTGNVIETKTPGGTSENVSPPTYSTAFGKEGTGNSQFKDAFDAAVDATGNVWVVDKNNHRVEKFSSSGSFMGAYGAEGTIGGDYEEAWGVAVNQNNGNVYVSDSSDNRIEELSSSGAFIETIGWGVSDGKAELEICKTSCRAGTVGEGNGQFNYPIGITIDARGNLWVADDGNNRVQELTEAGAYVTKFGSYGTGNGQFNGSRGIAISEGDIYVVDHGNNRVEEFSPTGTYLNQFGSKGKGRGQFEGPAGIAVNPNSSGIYVSDPSEDKIEEYSPAGKFLVEFGMWGTGHDQFENPKGLAINASGDLYVTEEYGNRVDELAPPGAGGAHMTYSTEWGSAGAGEGQFYWSMMSAIDGSGNIWSTDLNNSRVEKFSPSGKFLASYGKWGTGEVQFKKPTGIAINQSTGNVYVADCENNRIEELSSTGTYVRTFGSGGTGVGQFNCPGGLKVDSSGNVWVADTKNNRIQEFSSAGTFTAAYGTKGTGNGQFNEPTDIAISGSALYVTDTGNDRVQELSTSGTYIAQFGSEGNGGGNFFSPQGIATDASGHLYVSDSGDGRIEQFTASGGYLASFGTQGSSEGQFARPNGVAITSAGNMVVTDSSNNRIQLWANTNQAVHDTKTIYYTAGEEAEVSACRKHPEWVNLACQSLPVAQPETPELPNLPVSTIKSYNLWNEPETITETFGTTTRTKKTTFDSAGRALMSEVSAPIDAAVSAVKDKYDEKTGVLTEETNTSGGKEVTIKRAINTLGQLETYTDADGSLTTYKHDIDGRITEVANVIEAGGKKETTYQKYSYDETTGLMTKLEDSGAGAFTATRDIEGRITSETYPNAMTASTTYGAAGEATSIRYEKTAHCATTCPETWFKETVVPTSNGEASQRTNTLTTNVYSYDTVGRLIQVQETPAGKGCATRLYGYDEESNRKSLTSRTPGTEGKCATEGGTTETHTYDAANRLTDPGVSYETLGNTTKLPGADAGGPEMEIKTEYYADGQAASQTQNGKTYKYMMDPSGRVRETKTETEGKTTTTITHYAGPGSAQSWTSEEEGKAWTRNIPGLDGSLTAIQPSIGTIKLQIHDLQGNVVETASDLETETKILTSYNSTEFGAPLNGPPPTKYSWLGAAGVSTEQASGLVTQDGVTYVPQTGRPLQTQGIALPTPEDQATAFVSTIGAGVEYAAADSAAQQLTNALQAQEALELEEMATEEDEPDPEHGHNVDHCSVTASWGKLSYPGHQLIVWGHYKCELAPFAFEMQIAIMVEMPDGTFKTEHTHFHQWTKEGSVLDFGDIEYEFECKELRWYKAWVWGRYWEPLPHYTEWQGSRFDGRREQCGAKVINVPEFTPGPD